MPSILFPARGARVGSYVIVGEIGRGGMAVVFEAEHAELKKRVAIKMLQPHLALDEASASRFLREGKAAAQIRHPHVVNVFDVGTHEGLPYLVMEKLDGVDLAKLVHERGALPVGELADLMLPVIAAVNAAHEAGVIHRDLKPSNVVISTSPSGERTATVLDFGISKATRDPSADVTASEVLLGTVHYLSPEQTRTARSASVASDQYALGVMLYECATGAKPFHGASHYALMHAIVSSSVLPPSELAPSLPRAFDALVARAMHRDPAKRFPSVKALGAALGTFASPSCAVRWRRELGDSAAVTTLSAEPPIAPAKAPRGRRAWLGAAIAGCVVAAIGAAAVRRDRPAASEATTSGAGIVPAARMMAPDGESARSAARSTPEAESARSAARSTLEAESTPAPTVAARVEDAPPIAPTVPVGSAKATAPPLHGPTQPPSRAPSPSASSSAERGTNGAFIVE